MSLRLSSFVCVVVIATAARAQTAPPVTLPGTQQFDLTSEVNGHSYRLYVAPPDGYAPEDTTRYPVLYVLDGYFSFPAAVSARGSMGIVGGLEEVIVVGIGDGDHAFDSWFSNRWRDYTPSSDPAADSTFAEQFGLPVESVRSGGGREFLSVMKEEVVPFIDGTFRTTADRGLSGHSFGGLFAAYALFEAPSFFQRYGINSPSLWWNGGEAFDMEVTFAADHTDLPARVFLSVGSEEGSAMVPPMKQFAEALQDREYPGLQLETVVFEGETHASVVPAMMSRTLRVLYGRRR